MQQNIKQIDIHNSACPLNITLSTLWAIIYRVSICILTFQKDSDSKGVIRMNIVCKHLVHAHKLLSCETTWEQKGVWRNNVWLSIMKPCYIRWWPSRNIKRNFSCTAKFSFQIIFKINVQVMIVYKCKKGLLLKLQHTIIWFRGVTNQGLRDLGIWKARMHTHLKLT